MLKGQVKRTVAIDEAASVALLDPDGGGSGDAGPAGFPPCSVPLAAARGRLDRLWARGRAFLGCDLAILGGAMTWVSESNLVAAISNGGGFGVLASGSMPRSR
jgi:enoyl-[acyl-carrier protein] reductase II